LLNTGPRGSEPEKRQCHIAFQAFELCVFLVDQAAYLLEIQRQIHNFSCL